MFDPVLVTPSIPSSSFLPYLSLLGVPDFRQHLADGHGHFPVPQGPAGREETPAMLSLLYSERGEERGGGVVSSFPRSLNWLTADPHTLQPVPSPNSCPFPTTDCCFVL